MHLITILVLILVLVLNIFLISPAHADLFQAEDYTYFYDLSEGNSGGAYRADDVDIEETTDTDAGYNVGWIDEGEWLSFSTLDIPSSGDYTIRLRVASISSDGALSVDLDGGTIVLGTAEVPNTGGWQSWQTIEFTTTIEAGEYSLGVYASAGGWNLNWIEVVASETSSSTPTSTSQYRSEKRGLAYGYHSANDLKVMQQNVRWWYNWSVTPESSAADVYEDYDFDFVPMAWNSDFDETSLRSFLDTHPNVQYILGFNEPNFAEQANMTPAQAAAAWPRIEAIANDYNLKIVSPAVNYSPGNVDIPGTDDDSSPWAYLDAFFEACPDCQVDYIAIHCYMKEAAAVEWFVSEFERYGKPLWLTEWASWDDGGPADVGEQMDYLATTVRMLEANSNVFRYSWFIGRYEGQDVFPYLDILADDGELTPLGGLYTSIPSLDFTYQVPVRIEAEGAHHNSGFQHEKTTDDTGYVNLTGTDIGDWLEYEINVPSDGSYSINFRAATNSNNQSFNVLMDGEVLFTQTVDNTGGLQAWSTFENTVNLTAGQHTLRIEALTENFNLNWIDITNN
jgi:hypothetical protein